MQKEKQLFDLAPYTFSYFMCKEKSQISKTSFILNKLYKSRDVYNDPVSKISPTPFNKGKLRGSFEKGVI